VSRNHYAEINLHLTWHTKESAELLVPDVERVVHHYLRGRCINTPGVFVHAVGGIETHVHLAVSIAPMVLISEFVGQLKGASAHEANHRFGRKVLEWQTGYGVVSFGTRDLPWVVEYVENQKERHAAGKAESRLERITAPETADGVEATGVAAEAEPRESP
jgi:putative transposase